jgi:hypothetical protein
VKNDYTICVTHVAYAVRLLTFREAAIGALDKINQDRASVTEDALSGVAKCNAVKK